ncbi:MAG: AmmeMemoRadiSam system radical SAM enzyme [Coriobacteriales bacterium]|jgi:pyruvate formate lyase activating enzyme
MRREPGRGSETDRGGTGAEAPGATCGSCPHRCRLREGQTGRCRARSCRGGEVRSDSYGRLTSIALDPIEKKPIALWRPGSRVLSVGSYGCSMDCPFCQNAAIARAGADDVEWRAVTPEELVDAAGRLRETDESVIGIAYTYNEPLTFWEYVRDCSRLAHERGLANVLVSNGMSTPEVLSELEGLIDAANIDLKAFDEEGYRRLGGDLASVRSTIETIAAWPGCHLEVTTLVVPGISDSARSVDEAAAWLAGLPGDIAYHLTRFFPCHRMADASPTPVETIRGLAEVARRRLPHVLVGNC